MPEAKLSLSAMMASAIATDLAKTTSNLKTRIAENVEWIDLFHQECSEREHTDVGEAWKVLNDLRASLKSTLTLL